MIGSPAPGSALPRLRYELASLRLDVALARLRLALKAGFDEFQPRDGRGRWVDTGRRRDVLDDAQWASGRRRSPTRVMVNGRPVEATPGQAARLAAAQARADEALRKVRERDPDWRPTPSLRENVEGEIRAREAEAQEAGARFRELQRAGIGPGPFAGESIPARGPERDFTAGECREINRIGRETGCHTCGTTEPGTESGNFIPDHQLPNARNSAGQSQRLFPQCQSCSRLQGLWISRERSSR